MNLNQSSVLNVTVPSVHLSHLSQGHSPLGHSPLGKSNTSDVTWIGATLLLLLLSFFGRSEAQTVDYFRPSIRSFTASPATINSGGAATLTWSVRSARSLTIDNGLGTVTGTSVSVRPAQTTTYTLTATNTRGTVTARTTVTVNVATTPAPTISSFIATPATINSGASTTLSWTAANATSLSISGVGAVTGTSRAVTPAQTTTYVLTATNATSSTTRSVVVNVNVVSTPPVDSSSHAVPNNTVPISWSFCSTRWTGTGCEFDGMRQVRIGTGNKWVIKKFLHRLNAWDCNNNVFGGDAAPGQDQHCEVANIREEGTLPIPAGCYDASGGCPTIDLTKIPLGSAGFSTVRIQPDSSVLPQTPYGGSFRTECEFSHMAFNDPIVFPSQPGRSHLHVFYGNTNVSAFSTAESIANSGNSTCAGGIANRTAYWIPALIDTRTGAPIVPDNAIWYYKTFMVPAYPPSQNQPLPTGLRMIAGDMHATGPQRMTSWSCFGSNGGASIPTNCAVGTYVEMGVSFPSCWDGVNLDSVDHKSHMSYSLGAEGCPTSHPVPVPEIKLNVRYLVQDASAPAHWRLSSDHAGNPAGLSAHADWFDGWIPTVRETWVKNCSQRMQDCGVNVLGDGTRLY